MTREHVAAVRASVLLSLALFALILSAQTPATGQSGGRRLVPGALRARAVRDGRVRVIVELALPNGHVPEGRLPNAVALAAQRRDINGASARVLAALQSSDRLVHRYVTVPYVALEVGAGALDPRCSAPGGSWLDGCR